MTLELICYYAYKSILHPVKMPHFSIRLHFLFTDTWMTITSPFLDQINLSKTQLSTQLGINGINLSLLLCYDCTDSTVQFSPCFDTQAQKTWHIFVSQSAPESLEDGRVRQIETSSSPSASSNTSPFRRREGGHSSITHTQTHTGNGEQFNISTLLKTSLSCIFVLL